MAIDYAAAVERLREVAGVEHQDWMQDWPVEVADGGRARDFVAAFTRVREEETVSTLALVLALESLEQAGPEGLRHWRELAGALGEVSKEWEELLLDYAGLEQWPDGRWYADGEEPEWLAPFVRRELVARSGHVVLELTELDLESVHDEEASESLRRILGVQHDGDDIWPMNEADADRVEEFLALVENTQPDTLESEVVVWLVLQSIELAGVVSAPQWERLRTRAQASPRRYLQAVGAFSGLKRGPGGSWVETGSSFWLESLAEALHEELLAAVRNGSSGAVEAQSSGTIVRASRRCR